MPGYSRSMVMVLTFCIAVIGANSLALGPIAPTISADFDVSIARAVLATGGYGLGTAIGALFLSWLVDGLGPRTALVHAFGVLGFAFSLSAWAPTVEALVAAQFLAGLSAGVALPAVYAFTAAIAPKGHESEILGRVLVGWTLSMVAGVSLSAVLADLIHWRGVYLGLLAAVLLAIAGVFHFGRAPDRPSARPVGRLPALRAFVIPGVTPLIVICLGYMTAFYGTYAYLGDHVNEGLGLPVWTGGLIALTYGIGFGLAAFGTGLVDRLGRARVMPTSFAAIAVIYGVLALGSGHYVILCVGAFLWGLVNHFGLNLIVASLSEIDPARRGAILGLNSAATYLAACVGAVGFGPLYEAFGFAGLGWAACAATALAALLALFRSHPTERLARDM